MPTTQQMQVRIEAALKRGEVLELEPGEVPPFWRSIPFPILQQALTFGLIIPGYTCKDYLNYAVETGGYETVEIWGVQGSCKSNRTLQMGYWIYGDWDIVLKHISLLADASDMPQYKERGFLQRLQAIQKGKRSPWEAWDDLTVDLSCSSWRTDIEKYEAIDSAFAAIRTKVNTIVVNNPLIDRIPKNIKDNITIEVFVGRNQAEMIERYIRLPGLGKVESNFFKLQVEPIHTFNKFDVPTSVFKEYWNIRLEIADYAVQKMAKAFDQGTPENMIDVATIVNELGLSPATVYELTKQGVVKGKKIQGQLYIDKASYEQVIKPYYAAKQAKRQQKHN